MEGIFWLHVALFVSVLIGLFIGAWLAVSVVCGIAVAVGAWLQHRVSIWRIRLVSGVLLLGLAAWTVVEFVQA